MPLATTFAGDSARAEGLFSSVISISQSYWSASLSNSSLASVGKKIVVDGSGNIYVCGYSQPASAQTIAYVAKYNSSGVLQWQRTLTDLQTSKSDVSNAITIDGSGNVYVAGNAKYDSSNNQCLLVYKLDNSGTIQWQYTMVDTANLSSALANYGITIDSSNNVYVVGTSISAGTKGFCSIYKLNNSGTLQWQKSLTDTYTGKVNFAAFNNVAIDSSGNLYVVGKTTNNSTGSILGIIAKYDSSGVLQWQQNIPNNFSSESSVTTDSSGNLYIVGNTGSSSGAVSILIFKLSSSGTIQWQRTLKDLSTSPNNAGTGISVDSSGYVYVSGYGLNNSSKTCMSISKWDNSGTIQWQRTFTDGYSTPNSIANFMSSDNLGNIYFGGYINNSSGVTCISLSKFPNDGSKTGTYTGSTFGFTYATSSWTVATSTFTISTSTNTDATSAMTNSSSSFTAATSTGTTETITV